MEAIMNAVLSMLYDAEATGLLYIVIIIPTLYIVVRMSWFNNDNKDDAAEFNEAALLEKTQVNLTVANIELLKNLEPSEKDYLINKAIAEGIFVDEDKDSYEEKKKKKFYDDYIYYDIYNTDIE